MSSSKILVIGATGGTGRATVEELLAAGHRVTAFSRHASRLESLLEDAPDRLRTIDGNVLRPEDLDRAVPGHDAVIVVLGISENPFRVRLFGSRGTAMNVRSAGTRNVIAAMKRAGVRRLVVQSTTIEKGNDFGWLNWARGDRVFMFVVAKIGAGIDFEQFYLGSFEVDAESGTVFVEMPPAQINYVAMDNSQTQVIDRDTGLFTKGDPKLESDARQVAEQVLRNAAIEAGILERAQKNARTIIEGLLLELGYARVVFGRDLPGV